MIHGLIPSSTSGITPRYMNPTRRAIDAGHLPSNGSSFHWPV